MKSSILTFILPLLLLGCKINKSQTTNYNHVYNDKGIKVYAKIITDTFPKASLLQLTSDHDIVVGKNTFDYKIQAYNLKDQSPSATTNTLANSNKGQHIHFIVDNKPYQAKYEPHFEAELDEGTHLVLAFLSRSYHESIKKKNAYVLKQYILGEEPPLSDIKNDPLLFYSRPKGTYKMHNDHHKILLDFYLVNTTLEEKGNKVKVHIDDYHSFTIQQWQPYIIEGLKRGEHTVQIELIDYNGKPILGPFNNSGKRKFIIE